MAEKSKSKKQPSSEKSKLGGDADDGKLSAPTTILRAANGDVIQFDDSGLVMKLSDRVIKDISRRLPDRAGPSAAIDPIPVTAVVEHIEASVLGGIDAWDVRKQGEWYLFHAHLPGQQGVRQFRRLIEPDDEEIMPAVIADTAGPVCAFLSLGGARRAHGHSKKSQFPQHVLAPGDGIGAVGAAGEMRAKPQRQMLQLNEMTRDAALADAVLQAKLASFSALPLCFVRSEYDASHSIAELRDGIGYDNFLTNLKSLQACAERLEKPAQLCAIDIDYTLEDVMSGPDEWLAGFYALIEKMVADIGKLKLRCPPIFGLFDCGTTGIADTPILRAQWHLAWQGHHVGFHFVAPSYMFKYDRFGRLDDGSLRDLAQMEQVALDSMDRGETWTCPTILLAEREPDPKVIRVRCQSMGRLVLDKGNPFGVGKSCGFSFEGTRAKYVITDVCIAPDDPNDILITTETAIQSKTLALRYGFGQSFERAKVDYPSTCGALRDDWVLGARSGKKLHRWALPAVVPVH